MIKDPTNRKRFAKLSWKYSNKTLSCCCDSRLYCME